MIDFAFATAGRAVFTIELPASYVEKHDAATHYTYRVSRRDAQGNYPVTYFVSLLTGPDNTADYRYLGILDVDTGAIRRTAKSCAGPDAVSFILADRLMQRLRKGEGDAVKAAGFDVHHEGCCGRCGRALTVPESVESGIGPECARRMSRG